MFFAVSYTVLLMLCYSEHSEACFSLISTRVLLDFCSHRKPVAPIPWFNARMSSCWLLSNRAVQAALTRQPSVARTGMFHKRFPFEHKPFTTSVTDIKQSPTFKVCPFPIQFYCILFWFCIFVCLFCP